jgi:hypothetical protein
MTYAQEWSEARKVWLRTEHNDLDSGEGEWRTCRLIDVETTNIVAAATSQLAAHDTTTPRWTRVTVWDDEACQGEPMFTTHWVQYSGPDVSPSTEHPPVPPAAKLAQVEEGRVLPFPPFTSVTSDGGQVPGGRSEQPAQASPGQPSEIATEERQEGRQGPLRIVLMDSADLENSEQVSALMRKLEDAAADKTDRAVVAWAQQLGGAMLHATEYNLQHYGGVEWYRTEYGISVVTQAASGLTAAFVSWRLAH